MTAIERQPADRADGVPNHAAGVVARADDVDNPGWITFVDLDGHHTTEAWISADADSVLPAGGGVNR